MDDPVVLGTVHPAALQPALVVSQSTRLVPFRLPEAIEALVDAARDSVLGSEGGHAEEQQLGEDQEHHGTHVLVRR